jgi:hypothetical protein
VPSFLFAGFQHRYPEPAALINLDLWHEFETANPDMLLGMYIFSAGAPDGSVTSRSA